MSMSGIVLVGGYSRRMGVDKATLPWSGGGTLLDHQIATLVAAGADPVMIGGRADQNNPRPDLDWVTDTPGIPGPLGGLLTGLQACPLPWLAVLAVDMPQFPAEQFAHWHQTAKPGQGWVIAGPKGYEPLAALYPQRALPLLLEKAGQGILRLQDHVETLVRSGILQVCEKNALQSASLANWNSPDDMRQM